MVERHYPESIESWKGHARKIKMNLRSTKKLVEEEEADRQRVLNLEDVTAEMGEDGVHHRIYNLAEDMDRKIFSDQTGRFPTMSYKGSSPEICGPNRQSPQT